MQKDAHDLGHDLVGRQPLLVGPDAGPDHSEQDLGVGLQVGQIEGAALLPVATDDVWLIAGATAAGAVVGMVGITPAGLGVREVAVAALLASRFGIADATAFAIATRVLDFAHELVLLPTTALTGRSHPRPETEST